MTDQLKHPKSIIWETLTNVFHPCYSSEQFEEIVERLTQDGVPIDSVRIIFNFNIFHIAAKDEM